MPRSPIAGGRIEASGLGRMVTFGLEVGTGGRGFESRDGVATSSPAPKEVCLLSIMRLASGDMLLRSRNRCHEEGMGKIFCQVSKDRYAGNPRG